MACDRSSDVRLSGENLVLIPSKAAIPPRSVFCSGVLLGELRGGLIVPSHHFFSAYGNEFIRRESISRGDARIEKYLRGEEIDALSAEGSGWCSILFDGVPLGGAKLSGGRLKNHYPKGLRKP